jgi:predicted nucleic acid-binding protein
MLKIYLDNCCYGRPFDDLSQEKINDEATAKMFIQSLVKYKSIALYYSFMSQAELDDSPFENSKTHILDFIETNAAVFISDNNIDVLKELTSEIMQTGIKIKDATHLASAIFAKCDYFITTDKRVINHETNKIKIVNPIEFMKTWRETE